MRKKNLDKLFQEKLENFSETPDEKVWRSIEDSLNKKKRSRKVIPIWWKLGGAAAVLVVALYLINPFEDGNKANPTVTEVETPATPNSQTKKDDAIKGIEKSDAELVDVDGNESENVQNSPQKSSSYVADEKEGTISSVEKKNSIDLISSSKENAVQVTEVDNEKTQNPKGNEPGSPAQENVVSQHKEAIIVAIPNNTQKTIGNMQKNESVAAAINENTDGDGLAQEKESGVAQIEEKPANETGNDAKEKSIFDEIAAMEEEEEAVTDTNGGRWSAGPSIAPVYFDAIGEGSPVHSIFVPNSKSGDLNLSYGLSVAYEISSKLKVRSGIHKVDYGYSTNDVEFSSSLESSKNGQIDHVSYTATSKNLVVASSATESSASPMESFAPTAEDVSAVSASQNGVMAQQFGYLEVPVELEYALVDKRFGVNLIGGLSSLFLVDNSISLTSGELTTAMGKANNVNSVNFSTNVGIGVNYKFSPKVQLNIEPVFKYQLNTFSETDGTFRPFTIGVYSGLSFTF